MFPGITSNASSPIPTLLFKFCSNEGKLGFNATIANLVDLSTDKSRLALWRRDFPDTYTNNTGLNLTKACNPANCVSASSASTAFFTSDFTPAQRRPTILRVERPAGGITIYTFSCGWPPAETRCVDQFLNECSTATTVRSMTRRRRYFDDSLARLVAERDGTVIDRYGYAL